MTIPYLYEDFKDEPQTQFLFNENSISFELFDKWWLIERFELSENIREAEYSLERLHKENIQLTGNRSIDTWLSGKFLVPKLCLGMPSPTLRVVLFTLLRSVNSVK